MNGFENGSSGISVDHVCRSDCFVHHEDPSAAEPQSKRRISRKERKEHKKKNGISPAKTWFDKLTTLSKVEGPRPQRSEKMNRMVCKIINLSIPNLAYFAPLRLSSGHAWRESILRVQVFQVTGKFAPAAKTVKDSNTKDTKGSDD